MIARSQGYRVNKPFDSRWRLSKTMLSLALLFKHFDRIASLRSLIGPWRREPEQYTFLLPWSAREWIVVRRDPSGRPKHLTSAERGDHA